MSRDAVRLCYVIAAAAHGARGQKRADDVTPYITHPNRVAGLVQLWNMQEPGLFVTPRAHEVAMEAAWLHDVLEDTRLTRDDLIELGVPFDTIEVVERLTKPKPVNAPATPEYYQGIADHSIAIIVKAADRVANLEDALREVKATRGLKRWGRYVEKTRTDVLPIYNSLPFLRRKIEISVEKIEDELLAEISP